MYIEDYPSIMHHPNNNTQQEERVQAFLSENEARVLGSLIEKEITTPDYYPMTLKALTSACNQKSNRDPVLMLTENDVLQAFDATRKKALSRVVEAGASRVPKYRQLLTEVLHLTPPQTAIFCELLLRGAQTQGELRSRAERMYAFTSLAEVEAVVEELSSEAHPAVAITQTPLVMSLPRRTGQKEARFMHLVCGLPSASAPVEERASHQDSTHHPGDTGGIATLEKEVAALRQEVSALREDFLAFKRQLE